MEDIQWFSTPPAIPIAPNVIINRTKMPGMKGRLFRTTVVLPAGQALGLSETITAGSTRGAATGSGLSSAAGLARLELAILPSRICSYRLSVS
jgi:hypothetical protein